MIIHGPEFDAPGKGLIFVHIPKVAGTSIEKAFGLDDPTRTNYHSFTGWDPVNSIWMQHATMLQIMIHWRKTVKDYFKFTFVRNPYARAVSDWLWFKNDVSGSSKSYKHTTLKDYLLGRDSFKQIEGPGLRETYRSDHFLSQSEFILKDESNVFNFNFIGKFENIDQDWETLMERISNYAGVTFDVKLPHRNKSKSKKWHDAHYSTYYDDETRELATKRYELDLKLFGYTFEEDPS